MGIAHVCAACGASLTRVRAFDDPHYGLKLVRCAGCGRVGTRGKHPISEGWRRARTLLAIAVRMLGTVMPLGLVTFFLFMALHATMETLAAAHLNPYELLRLIGGESRSGAGGLTLGAMPWADRTGVPLMMVFCSIACGMILGGSLTHHRLVPLMLGWGGVLVGGFVAIAGGVWLWETLHVALERAQLRGVGMRTAVGTPELAVEWVFDMAIGLIASVMVAGMGMVIGRSLSSVERVWSQRRWRRLRRSLVRRRESR